MAATLSQAGGHPRTAAAAACRALPCGAHFFGCAATTTTAARPQSARRLGCGRAPRKVPAGLGARASMAAAFGARAGRVQCDGEARAIPSPFCCSARVSDTSRDVGRDPEGLHYIAQNRQRTEEAYLPLASERLQQEGCSTRAAASGRLAPACRCDGKTSEGQAQCCVHLCRGTGGCTFTFSRLLQTQSCPRHSHRQCALVGSSTPPAPLKIEQSG